MNETLIPFGVWRHNFLFDKGNGKMLTGVLLIQLIGVSSLTMALFFLRERIKSKIIFWAIFLLMCLLTIFVYLTFDTSINFKPAPIL